MLCREKVCTFPSYLGFWNWCNFWWSQGDLLISVQTGWSFPCSKGRCSTIILCGNELCHIPLPSISMVANNRDGIILSFSSNCFYCEPLFRGPFSENLLLKLSWSLWECRGWFVPAQKVQMRALISTPLLFSSCPCPSLSLFIMSVEPSSCGDGKLKHL